MTQSEFYAAIKQSRRDYLDIFLGVNTEISKVYISAADEVADKIKVLEINRKGNGLTAKSLKDLEKTLRKTGKEIASKTEPAIINGINNTSKTMADPHFEFITDGINLSGSTKITGKNIGFMYAEINRRIVDITYSRVWADGYTFSNRILGIPGELPGLSEYWQQEVKKIITSGFAQNRDVLQIAKDLSVYTRKGKPGLVKRYGELVQGTKKFIRRIPKNIDWRALRIARSELYASQQEAAVLQGRGNPGVKMYVWNLTSGAVHECICPDLATNSPYRENEVPDYPHPSCLCYITFQLRGRDEFVNDLIAWDKGIITPYLDSWYHDTYLPFIR